MHNWRLMPLMNGPGAMHMAIDEWLLDQHRLGKSPSVLRFYTWTPSSISLGYHQKRWPEHWSKLTWNGQPIDLVRRPSGGRAVLHHGDLTYAIITSGFAGSRMEVYKLLCQFLIEGWRSLGIPLQCGSGGRGYIHNPNCFGTATTADLVTAKGMKFIGSAQLRRGQAILQHGSMQLCPDSELLQQVFGVPTHRMTGSHNIGQSIPEIVNVLTNAACRCFSVGFQSQPLTQDEWDDIACTSTQRGSMLNPENLCEVMQQLEPF